FAHRAPSGTPSPWSGDDGYLIARCATRLSSSRGGEDLDVSVGSVQADPLPILDQLRGVFYPDDGQQAVFPCDHWAMGHQAPDLGDQARDRHDQGGPAAVGEN